MPAKKKEAKTDEPLFVDEEGTFIHEEERAKYHGGVRRYCRNDGATSPSSTVSKHHSAANSQTLSPPPAGVNQQQQQQQQQPPQAPVVMYRHGHGSYSCPSLSYEGDWVEDEMHGHGRLTFHASGNSYDGEFRHGCFSGTGLYRWNGNGTSYHGQWRANRMHGEGVYTDADGRVWRGRYYNGVGPGLAQLFHLKDQHSTSAVSPQPPLSSPSG